MKKKNPASDKGQFTADVIANTHTGYRFYKLILEFSGPAAAAYAKVHPGQFAQFDTTTTALPPTKDIPEDLRDAATREILLRRPFSFCDITTSGNKTTVEILYHVLGPATLRMTTLSPGDSISIIGPLGNGFSVPKKIKTAILVAGGMGTPPLIHLAKVLSADRTDVKTIMNIGAKTKNHFPIQLDQLKQLKTEQTIIATDDGSAGFHGFVTDCLTDQLTKSDFKPDQTIIYSCGPEPMLASVAKIAAQHNIPSQLSTERTMACGIGLCQSCAVECKTKDPNKTIYKLCCKDGPVFDGDTIIFKT